MDSFIGYRVGVGWPPKQRIQDAVSKTGDTDNS